MNTKSSTIDMKKVIEALISIIEEQENVKITYEIAARANKIENATEQ